MHNVKSAPFSEVQLNRYLSLLLCLALLNFAYITIFFISKGYLPEPFLHNKWDTFMDFYNPLFWANQEGIFTEWKSVYPPLNFIILKIYSFIFIDNIYEFSNGLELRPLPGLHTILLIIFFNLFIILSVVKSFSQIINRNQVIVVSIIILISPASLFALERGNLIILSLYIFTLYVCSKSQLKRILFFSILINLKPYFLVIYLFELIKKKSTENKKEFLILSPLLSTLIFLVTGTLINQEYHLIFLNILGFSSGLIFQPAEIFAMPSTAIIFEYLPNILNINLLKFILYIPKIIIYLLIILCLFQFYNKKISNDYFIIFIVLFLTNYSITTGGYAALLYIPILPILLINREYKIFNILVLTFFIGLWDIVNLFLINTFEFHSYLSQEYNKIEVYFTLGTLVRPLANMIALFIFYKSLRRQHVG